jgi:hypothetical protein
MRGMVKRHNSGPARPRCDAVQRAAQKPRDFLLTLTYTEVGNTDKDLNLCSFRNMLE